MQIQLFQERGLDECGRAHAVRRSGRAHPFDDLRRGAQHERAIGELD